MIISERGGFIFVHNPKAGGMSMRTALKPWDDSDGFFDGWRPYPAEGRRLDRMHLTLAQLRRHHPDAFAAFDRLWSFGFVRDPYQRLCSAFSQHLTLNTPILRDSIRGDPDVFYAVLNRFALRAMGPHAAANDVKLTHFTPQSAFFFLSGRQVVQEIARLDAPGTWSARLRDLLGPAGPERRNENPDKGGAAYDVSRLSPAVIARANAFYAEDFERFGFARIEVQDAAGA
ncbi:sulfotransferase family 2 domain-containing protein [Rhodovulum sp. DZ06]|uniref:sulfotransferase family 2 domain-containing protein n=1 Tax=Rhodovulum sp. DZ06 TaxID=3425126 RepID=UPI003D32A853